MAPRTAGAQVRLPTDALAEALALQDRVSTSPREVAVAAEALLVRPRLGAEASSVGRRTLARALRALDRPQDAVREARRAATIANRAGLVEREAQARLTLSLTLFQVGRATAAIDQIERAEALAEGHTASLASAQHGILLERLGRLEEALARYTAALAGPMPALDRAQVLNNRAIALAFTGQVDEAVADLDEAIVLARAEGAAMPEAELIHNRGFVLTVVGDLPGALAHFDDADARFAALGAPIGLNLVARARALLRANLHREALEAARAAVSELDEAGAGADAAEARVLLASAELAEGAAVDAIATAQAARGALRRQRRPALAALADHVIVRARAAQGSQDRRTMERALRCADALAEAGLVAEELDARLTAGLVARHLGDEPGASACLDAVRMHRHRGPLVERSRAWQAEAVHRLDRGDRGGARRAITSGLEAVGDLQALMGSTELQVGAAGHGAALAELGLRLAVGGRDPWAVLRVLDQWRGASLELGREGGGGDSGDGGLAEVDALAEDRDAVRSAAALLHHAVSEGEDPSAARRAVTDLESRVRARARTVGGTGTRSLRRLDRDALRRGLADALLVVYFELDGRMGAVSVVDGRARLHADLGADRKAVDNLIGAALFALRRLARPSLAAEVHEGARRSLEDASRRLDELLVAPIVGRHPPVRPLVICPTGPLHALAWSALPSCAARAISVVPALAAITSRRDPPVGGGVVLAAGPGLGGALTELHALSAIYPDARTFGAEASAVDEVLAALEGSETAHLACHGTFRIDNPMFSSLQLADGAMTVFDLEKLRRAPRLVVLAACDVGTAAVSAGDELLGLAAALQRAGTTTVVASLVPVPDDAVVTMMVELHRQVAAGRPVPAALASARASVADDRPSAAAVRACFTCFGLG